MSYILLAGAVLFGAFLLLRLFVSASPAALVRGFKIGGVLLGIGAVVALAWSGRLPQVLAWLAPLAIFFLRGARFPLGSRNRPSPGRSSAIDTATLHMELDHDTGAMTGTVRQGPLAGRDLDELTFGQAMDLLAFCQDQDPESVPVLQAWLDRSAHADWRDRARAGGTAGAEPPPSGGQMTRDEALDILGLQPNADEAAIRDAHRRLMKQFHPDRGGSNYLASQINRAKDVLLGG